MTNKSTKKALLLSVLSMLLCVAMLVGTTFAWFTDSVTSGKNTIKAGNLDVALDYLTKDGKWETVQDATDLLDPNALWEPGHAEVVYLKISNLGTLALKYQFSMNIFKEVVGESVLGNEIHLSDYLMYGVVDYTDEFKTREEAIAAVADKAVKLNSYVANGDMEAGAPAKTIALVVYMPTTVGNEANYRGDVVPSIELGVQLLATQKVSEDDFFGNDYDEDALYGTYIELEAGANLLAAMASAEKDLPLTIKLNGNVEWPTDGHHGENDITPASSIVIDGNGYTITATGSGVTPLGDTEAPMTLKNVKIVDKSASYDEGAWEFTYLEMGGSSLNCENVTFADEIQTGTNATFTNCSFESNEESVYAVWVADGSAAFTNCTFTGYRGLKMHEDYGSEISSVIVKGCTFSDITKKPGIALGTLNAETTVSITGSTFINCQAGDQGEYIYETDTDVTTFNFVNENNTVVKDAKKIVDGVYENGTRNYYIYTAEGLQNVFAEVIPANKEQNQTVNLMADIDLAGIIWQPINNMHFTFNGNNHTISNITCAEGWRSGFFGYAGGVKVNNLTLENVASAGAQAGTFAGSAEGLNANNCFLKGTNTVTYVPYATETWGGIGAVTGVNASSTINVEIAADATVTLNYGAIETQATYIDELTGYLNANNGTVVNNGAINVVKTVATADELAAALKGNKKNIEVTLANSIDWDLGTGLTLGGADTETITIKGAGASTVLNLSSTYRNYFNSKATLILENLTVTNSQTGSGFYDYTTHFNCDVVASNVTFTKPIMINKDADFTDIVVDLDKADTYYAMFIMAGNEVSIDGAKITAQRGIKIADEDISNPQLTKLSVKNAEFDTDKKAAILVTSTAGANIVLDNVDISNVAADKINAVWVDEARTASYDLVSVSGGNKVQE